MLMMRPVVTPRRNALMIRTLSQERAIAHESDITLLPLERRKWVKTIVAATMIQCVIVWTLSATVLFCYWSPHIVTSDYQKLIRVMYLYDHKACRSQAKETTIRNLFLSNDTQDLDVTPIKYTPPVVTMSARVAKAARVHVISSATIHGVWMLSAILMVIFIKAKSASARCLKFFITIFFYVSIVVTSMDISMAIVYVSHIQQSLTNGMVLRHSGWSVEITMQGAGDFAGWIPMAAAACWMRATLYILWGWITLGCRLQPNHDELQEMTLMKLLYLYDPQACGRIYFYNYTVSRDNVNFESSIQWPVKNEIAANYRRKMKLCVALHILWLGFCIAYLTQGHRICGYYMALIPFTLVGVSILVVDVVHTALFLVDASKTETEMDILNYINLNNDSIHFINTKRRNMKPSTKRQSVVEQDTSWISIFFAYASCRGIVFWMFDFWLIKDNFMQGLAYFRKIGPQRENNRREIHREV